MAVDEKLLEAVVCGDLSRVRSLLSSGPPLSPEDAGSLLIDAILAFQPQYGTEVAQLVVDLGKAPPTAERDGIPALGVAAGLAGKEGSKFTTSAPLVELLLSRGFAPDSPDMLGSTPLHAAAGCGDTGAIDTLITGGASVLATGHLGFSPLHEAANGGHVDAVECLLKRGAFSDARSEDGSTPLMFACSTGSVACIKALTKAGLAEKCVPLVDSRGWTALHHVIQGGSHACLLVVFSAIDAIYGGNPAGRGPVTPTSGKDKIPTTVSTAVYMAHGSVPEGLTALHLAASLGSKTAVSELLKRKVPANTRDAAGRTALMHATSVDVFRLLCPVTDLLARETATGRTVFHITCAAGLPQCLDVLLPHLPLQGTSSSSSSPSNSNSGSGSASTKTAAKPAASSAASKSKPPSDSSGGVASLLDNWGLSPLHHACGAFAMGPDGCVSTVSDASAPAAAAGAGGRGITAAAKKKGDGGGAGDTESHPLGPVAQCVRETNPGHTMCAERLLGSTGSDEELRGLSCQGSNAPWLISPLHCAALSASPALVPLLADAMADLDATAGMASETPLMLAVRREGSGANAGKGIAVAAALIDAGASLEITNARRETVLHIAAQRPEYAATASVLLRSGAKRNAVDATGRTPTEVAKTCGNDKFLSVLASMVDTTEDQNPGGNGSGGSSSAGSGGGDGASQRSGHSNLTDHPTGDHPSHVSGVASSAKVIELHAAATSGDLSCVMRLIKGKEVDPDSAAVDGSGQTPMHVAAYHGHPDILGALLDAGALVDPRDREGLTPLHSACQAGTVDCVAGLVNRGAKVDVTDGKGRNPLHYAACFPERDCLKIVLRRAVQNMLASSSGGDSKKTDGNGGINEAASGGRPGKPPKPAKLGGGKALGERAAPAVVHADSNGETPLHFAATNGSADCAQLLIDHLAPIDARNVDRWTPLHKACRKNYTGCAAVLIDAGANVNAATVDLLRPLHLAAMSGKVGCAALLLDRGCNVDPACVSKRTPLCDACEHDDVKLATLFLNKGASVVGSAGEKFVASGNGADGDGGDADDDGDGTGVSKSAGPEQPLHVCARTNAVRCAQLLLRRGAPADALCGADAVTPLHVACAQASSGMLELLLGTTSVPVATFVNVRNAKGLTPLDVAMERGWVDGVRVLRASGGASASDLAANGDSGGGGNGDVGANGAAVGAGGRRKSTLRPQSAKRVGAQQFLDAVAAGDVRGITMLLAKGADVNGGTLKEGGLPPLHLAASLGLLDVVSLLISKNARLEATDAMGRTALHLAAEQGHASVTKLLIARGCSITAKDNRGRTPLHLAAERSGACTGAMVSAGNVDVNTTDREGMTPLHYSAMGGTKESLEYLIRSDADIDARDKRGWSALHVSCEAAGASLAAGADANGGDTSAVSEAMPKTEAETIAPWTGVVEELLRAGADVNTRSLDGLTPLHLAAKCNSVELAEGLIEAGASVSAVTAGGWTPLHTAAAAGSLDLVRLLVVSGAPLNAPNSDGQTPLTVAESLGLSGVAGFLYSVTEVGEGRKSTVTVMQLIEAVEAGKVTEVCRMLDAGGHLTANDSDPSGWRALHYAAKHGYLPMGKALIDRGADPNATEHTGRTPLHIASESSQSEFCKFLLAHGSDPALADDAGCTPLHYAAMAASGQSLSVLVPSAEVTSADTTGCTPLHYAARAGADANVASLLAHGADIAVTDDRGWSPLHEAASRNNLSCALVLIDAGANVNVRSADGATPLHLAAFCSEADCAVLLIEQGAVVNARGSRGYTPLHEACSTGDQKLVTLLLQRNADPNGSTDFGESPLQLASRAGYAKIVALLLKHRSRIRHADGRGWTALHEASYGGHAEVVSLLLRKNADPTLENSDGHTSYDLAEAGGHTAIATMLANKGGGRGSGASHGGSGPNGSTTGNQRNPRQRAAPMAHRNPGQSQSQSSSSSRNGSSSNAPPMLAAMRGSHIVRRGNGSIRQRAMLQSVMQMKHTMPVPGGRAKPGAAGLRVGASSSSTAARTRVGPAPGRGGKVPSPAASPRGVKPRVGAKVPAPPPKPTK